MVKYNEVIVVDSTHKRTSVPDALSKTVPIWYFVINSALFNKDELFFPPEIVSLDEQNSIKKEISTFC